MNILDSIINGNNSEDLKRYCMHQAKGLAKKLFKSVFFIGFVYFCKKKLESLYRKRKKLQEEYDLDESKDMFDLRCVENFMRA